MLVLITPGVSKGVAIGEMKRNFRTNTHIETFNAFQKRHRFNLCKRGQSLSFANHHIDKVKFLNRSFELKRKIKTKISKIPFVTRYTPSGFKAFKIIKNIGTILGT